MKVFFMFITTVVCNITYGHKNPVVKQAYSNVIITTSASDYVEEMNKTLIIGKNGQIDHLIPEQIDHRFRFKMTT